MSVEKKQPQTYISVQHPASAVEVQGLLDGVQDHPVIHVVLQGELNGGVRPSCCPFDQHVVNQDSACNDIEHPGRNL